MTLASIASGADGIMLEVHPDPENAAVDPLQPINFKTFDNLMESMEKVAQSVDEESSSLWIKNSLKIFRRS